ncbi:ketopantoate reductase family protein [Tissierella creatinini]|nr:ketopantoate reductase family protein [Tissierella creatinini]TJX62371.1 ketopantoate reductase family protein [Soehngenia saccharolytica]
MEINRVSIVGMGALGILFGGFLTDKMGKEKVEFIVNKDRMKKFKDLGLTSNGKLCDFNLVDEEEQGKPADLLIFTVKAGDLDSAIDSARNKVSDNTIIMSLLNGITSEEIIGERYGKDKLVYSVAQGMDATKVGNKFTYSNLGQLCIGIMDKSGTMKEKLNRVKELFDKNGLPYTIEVDIKHRLWSKFMLNVGVNQVVMIYEGTYGTIHQPGEARELMIAAMREVIPLANAENVGVTEKDLEDYVALVDTLDPKGMPSMRQDGLAGRKTEVELFSGTVLKLGKKHGIPTPVNQKIYDRVREMEKEY